MNNHFPISSPPPELVQQWLCSDDFPWEHPLEHTFITITNSRLQNVATQAARWGWDQRGTANEAELQEARDEELEACCDHIYTLDGEHRAEWLHDIRRPKPPSLKEQALQILDTHGNLTRAEADTIRRALEQLPDAL